MLFHTLVSSAFTLQGDKIEHCFEPISNHSAIKFFRRKRIQSEIGSAMRKRSGITPQTQ
jgi:hypothetical protein